MLTGPPPKFHKTRDILPLLSRFPSSTTGEDCAPTTNPDNATALGHFVTVTRRSPEDPLQRDTRRCVAVIRPRRRRITQPPGDPVIPSHRDSATV
jgi:hypothetical protein